MPKKLNINKKVNALRAFFRRERRMPGYNEMLKLFNYRSKTAVHGLILKLAEQGYLLKNRGKIALTGKALGKVKLLGLVQAGFPSPAEEELIDTVSLDEFLVNRPDATFMLKVSGDSMIDAGIHPGDLVLVERGIEPKSNDIVIAQVDGEWTMKYFVKDNNGVRLEPANRNYKTIRPRNSIEIAGVVRTVIRKYA